MKRAHQTAFVSWRFYLILVLILLVVAGLVARVVDLTVINRNFLLKQGNTRVIRTLTTPAFRGIIADRNGYPLAISTAVYSIWINPKEYLAAKQNDKLLSSLLGVKPKQIEALVLQASNKKSEFLYVKRGVSPVIAEQIHELQLPGVHTREEYKRYYPEGEITAHLIGFTNVDDRGQEGLELAYNQWLSGTPGKKLVMKDRLGRAISNVQVLQEQKPGNDLTLSIDRRIQYLAYRELLAGVEKNLAQSGSVVVLDVKTGEILAMVNQPSYNPNNRISKRTDVYRNRAITDVFEPGSTIKAFSIASALDSGKYKPTTMIDTAPGWMRVGKNIVKDEHSKGLLTVAQILQFSSNVGTAKMILSLPPDQLWSLLHRVGFGEPTGINFPGEQTGSLINRTPWKPFALATLAFGYGVSASTLQLAQAYSVIANEGIKLPVSLIKVENAPQGEQAMNAKVAKAMLQMLEEVTTAKGATGEYAKVPGYRVAGKTGTAVMAGPKGYQKRHYVSSFVGIAPVAHPRLVVAVIVNEPRGKVYYGGLVSAPIFEKIMEGALRILNVPPDNLAEMEEK